MLEIITNSILCDGDSTQSATTPFTGATQQLSIFTAVGVKQMWERVGRVDVAMPTVQQPVGCS